MHDNASELRNERIAPLADRARKIWSTLRQESNVDLGAIRLMGQKTTRRVVLEADVDGTDTEALGVMSQGELQALALAIFIPRATAEQSPFRFLVLDDPIQAMDPSKIDGFLDVLTTIAQHRQVIVLTHDDRLPAAIRRSRAPARIVEVARGANSVVTVTESSRPAKRLLDDAFAIGADEAVPAAVKRARCADAVPDGVRGDGVGGVQRQALTNGDAPHDVDAEWEKATTTRTRLGLAVDRADPDALGKWLAGGARAHALKVAAKGGHSDITDFKAAVNSTRLAVGDLAKLAS
ncbi:hypothetical protein [Mycolicibacterium arenosum]|uniref:Nuclease SbcCD subunit C n=1 Tax=Mycolicibacterium arenosum TaxID=2952157 RepID=A0ABT1M4H9_9MYCO|nr:hypothetical protein [Mycolicibacterium sp. CAU 1645]MCP9274073.1 hypothetical protein [Mycolicibacterium sp. CAU 1645]